MDVSPGTGIMGGAENAVTLITGRKGGRDLADPVQGRDGATSLPCAPPRPWPLSGKRVICYPGADEGAGVAVLIEVLREAWADPSVPLPEYATAGAAGADLRAKPRPSRTGCRGLFGSSPADGSWSRPVCGWRSPRDTRCRSAPRSGLALEHGIGLPNSPGNDRQRLIAGRWA